MAICGSCCCVRVHANVDTRRPYVYSRKRKTLLIYVRIELLFSITYVITYVIENSDSNRKSSSIEISLYSEF